MGQCVIVVEETTPHTAPPFFDFLVCGSSRDPPPLLLDDHIVYTLLVARSRFVSIRMHSVIDSNARLSIRTGGTLEIDVRISDFNGSSDSIVCLPRLCHMNGVDSKAVVVFRCVFWSIGNFGLRFVFFFLDSTLMMMSMCVEWFGVKSCRYITAAGCWKKNVYERSPFARWKCSSVAFHIFTFE